jgi:uncharacterized protein YgbK (DUF1537 family)
MRKLIIISDDLTGTADAGAFAVNYGKKIKILVDGVPADFSADNEDVLEINMSSRVIPGQKALVLHETVGNFVRTIPDTIILKKMDTGFRGNASFEIEGLLKSLYQKVCFVVDNIPELNTFTLYGNQYPEGQILPKSLYSKDPLKIQTKAYIPDILAENTDLPVGLIDIDSVKGEHLEEVVREKIYKGIKILVFDAVTRADTLKIVSLLDEKFHPLWAGSLGIAEALTAYLFSEASSFCGERSRGSEGRKCVCFTASAYDITRRQIEKAREEARVFPVAIDMHRFLTDEDGEIQRIIALCRQIFATNNFILFPEILKSDDYRGFDKIILSAVSRCSEKICKAVNFDRIVVVGGETSQAVFGILGIHTLQLTGKPETGIGTGIILDSPFRGKEFSLKGGSVGSIYALEEMINR